MPFGFKRIYFKINTKGDSNAVANERNEMDLIVVLVLVNIG